MLSIHAVKGPPQPCMHMETRPHPPRCTGVWRVSGQYIRSQVVASNGCPVLTPILCFTNGYNSLNPPWRKHLTKTETALCSRDRIIKERSVLSI